MNNNQIPINKNIIIFIIIIFALTLGFFYLLANINPVYDNSGYVITDASDFVGFFFPYIVIIFAILIVYLLYKLKVSGGNKV